MNEVTGKNMTIQVWYSGVLKGLFDKVRGSGSVLGKDSIHIFSSKITPDRFFLGNEGCLINFQSILETGKIPSKHLFGSTALGNGFDHILGKFLKYSYGSQHIDWDSDDAFIHALGTIRTRTMERVENDGCIQDLLQKEIWDKKDRIFWEQNISRMIAEEVDRIPNLNEYRTTCSNSFEKSAQKRPIRLNELSSDIENGTMDIEFDCEAMTAVEGGMLQANR